MQKSCVTDYGCAFAPITDMDKLIIIITYKSTQGQMQKLHHLSEKQFPINWFSRMVKTMTGKQKGESNSNQYVKPAILSSGIQGQRQCSFFSSCPPSLKSGHSSAYPSLSKLTLSGPWFGSHQLFSCLFFRYY